MVNLLTLVRAFEVYLLGRGALGLVEGLGILLMFPLALGAAMVALTGRDRWMCLGQSLLGVLIVVFCLVTF